MSDKKLQPTIDHLTDAKCREMLADMVESVQALGPLSSTDVTSELVDALEKHGIKWDHDNLPHDDEDDADAVKEAH